MIATNQDGDMTVNINVPGGGEGLVSLQKALILGIETIGSHKEHSGYEEYQEAVWILSDVLKQSLLSESQTNVGLGGRPYKEMKKEA
jgi:hypothetical protein